MSEVQSNNSSWWETPVQTRNERFASANPADFPALSARQPEWRLSPLDVLSPLVDATLDGGRYSVDVAHAKFEWRPLSECAGRAGLPEDALSATAWASTTDALHVTVSGDGDPVVIDRIVDGVRAAHLVIDISEGTHRTIIIDNHGAPILTENVEIIVASGAHARIVHLADWDGPAIHAASHFATVATGGELDHILVSLGGSVSRVNPTITLVGEGSRGTALGVAFVDKGRHVENRVYVHHAGPRTTSDVLYKNVLHGAGTRAVWVGDVLIGPAASGTNSYEANRNLLLSDNSRADSIPNLEIETGDIDGAGHASATGRLDDEQLFYLEARGIPEVEARRLVALGFVLDVVGRIGIPEIEDRLTTALTHALDSVEDNS